MASPDRLHPFPCCKKIRKAKRGNQTSGSTKGCVALLSNKIMTTHSRSYKKKGYSAWFQRILENAGKKRLKTK